LSGLENGRLGYQVNRKSGGRLSEQQDIRIIASLDARCSYCVSREFCRGRDKQLRCN